MPIQEEDTAWRVAKLMTRRHGHELLPYKCTWCGYWHVGHPSQRKQATGNQGGGN